MWFWRHRLLLPLAFVPLLSFVPTASAQLSNLDEVGKRFASEFKKFKPHPAIVNVADFSFHDADLALQSHYLAWYLSSSLEFRGKDFLRVPDHGEFDRDVARIKNASDSTLSPEDFSRISAKIGGDFIILGTVERKGPSFLLKLCSVRVSDGTLIDSGAVELHSEFLESLSIPLQPQAGQSLNRPGANGIGMLSCTYMPDPDYTDLGRGNKVNGTAVMEVVISPEGSIQQIHPTKLLGYGLDEQAYDTVKKWKCKPARDKSGIPVAVAVPVEITFHLY
jgi:TonB family protein